MSANLIIGSSHSLHFSAAIGGVSTTREEASKDLVKIESPSGNDNQLLFVAPKPAFIHLDRDAAGNLTPTFGPFMDKIRSFNNGTSKVIFGIGGNEHNAAFLCEHAKPFDFYHPSVPDTDPSRQIVPGAEIRNILRRLLEQTLLTTRLLAQELPLSQRYYLPPPPPIPSDAHIKKFPEIFDFMKFRVESPDIRLKIYNMYLEITQIFCTERRIAFLTPPIECRDKVGFLSEEYWSGCTHATPEYYHSTVSNLGL